MSIVSSCFESGFSSTSRILRSPSTDRGFARRVLRPRISETRSRPLARRVSQRPRPTPGALVAATALVLTSPLPADASSAVRGTVARFESPNGAIEKCVALEHMPGGQYSPADQSLEQELCGIDFYGTTHALCPKLFSTSPGTLVFDLRDGPYAGDPVRFERESCASGGVHKRGAPREPISYKMSVNTRESSATFANSALVYYHFARYFQASVHVPVAVLRSIDRREHGRRVSSPGVKGSAGKPALKMNHAAWTALQAAEIDPGTYRPAEELFTPDGLLYGVMLHPLGRRYGEEMNGTRRSGWGDGQNRDFQETAPFLALRSPRPLGDAIADGMTQAMRDPVLAKATGGATPQQLAFWMADLIDVTLLDYLLGQQDRVGNLDYLPRWYWVDDGQVLSEAAAGSTPPPRLSAFAPRRVLRTELGDNDAGVRVTYLNYAKRTGMLEKLRHYRAGTYRQLLRLEADFASGGRLHEYVLTTFGLSDREFSTIKANVGTAATILRESCKAGRLRFDVEPEEFLRQGAVSERNVSCEQP